MNRDVIRDIKLDLRDVIRDHINDVVMKVSDRIDDPNVRIAHNTTMGMDNASTRVRIECDDANQQKMIRARLNELFGR